MGTKYSQTAGEAFLIFFPELRPLRPMLFGQWWPGVDQISD